jgi:hypothetical protein
LAFVILRRVADGFYESLQESGRNFYILFILSEFPGCRQIRNSPQKVSDRCSGVADSGVVLATSTEWPVGNRPSFRPPCIGHLFVDDGYLAAVPFDRDKWLEIWSRTNGRKSIPFLHDFISEVCVEMALVLANRGQQSPKVMGGAALYIAMQRTGTMEQDAARFSAFRMLWTKGSPTAPPRPCGKFAKRIRLSFASNPPP